MHSSPDILVSLKSVIPSKGEGGGSQRGKLSRSVVLYFSVGCSRTIEYRVTGIELQVCKLNAVEYSTPC